MPVDKRLAALSLTRRNVLASFIGKLLIALLSLAFTPLYSRLLGIEAYGLIGFSITLNAALNLLDMGFSATMNREIAKLSAPLPIGEGQNTARGEVRIPPERADEARTLVRTLERVYWPICVLIAAGIGLLAPFLAHHWVHVQRLAPSVVQRAIVLMGFSLALQWPFTLYEGGLQGLQKQVWLNGIGVIVALLRNVVPLLILIYSPSILTYFAWQLVVSAFMTGSVLVSLWRALPASSVQPRFESEVLRRVWRFAAGMAGITTANLIITQADKGVLSRLFPLGALGYYTLALGAAGALYYFVAPLNNALFPRFVQILERQDKSGLVHLYHSGCQAMSVILLPVGMVLGCFAHEIMLLWTRDANTAEQTFRLVGWLSAGFVCNGLMTLPFSLQTAAGWTKLTLLVSAFWAVILVPLLLLLTNKFGPEGAAIAWLAMNFSHLFTIIPLMHRRLLRGEMSRWYLQDIGLPLLASGAVVLLFHWLPFPVGGRMASALWLVMVWLLATGATLAVAPRARALRNGKLVKG